MIHSAAAAAAATVVADSSKFDHVRSPESPDSTIWTS